MRYRDRGEDWLNGGVLAVDGVAERDAGAAGLAAEVALDDLIEELPGEFFYLPVPHGAARF